MPWVPRQVEKLRNHSATPTTPAVVVLGDVAEERGRLAEQAGGELLLGEAHLGQGALVVGELAHQPHRRGDVVGTDRPHAHDSASFRAAGTSRASGDSAGTRTGAKR